MVWRPLSIPRRFVDLSLKSEVKIQVSQLCLKSSLKRKLRYQKWVERWIFEPPLGGWCHQVPLPFFKPFHHTRRLGGDHHSKPLRLGVATFTVVSDFWSLASRAFFPPASPTSCKLSIHVIFGPSQPTDLNFVDSFSAKPSDSKKVPFPENRAEISRSLQPKCVQVWEKNDRLRSSCRSELRHSDWIPDLNVNYVATNNSFLIFNLMTMPQMKLPY